MTMKELAKLANVSPSTASKAFSGAEDVNEETRQHIFAVAKESGCYNRFFKGKFPKPIIAIIYPEIISQYYVRFVKVLSDLIEASGGICIVATDDFQEKKQEELIDYFCSYLNVDGILVFSLRSHLKKAYDTPIVVLLSSQDETVDCVKTSFAIPINNLAELLSDYGHQNIAFISESLTQKKLSLFQDAVAKHDMTLTVIESSERFEKAGEDGVRQLIHKKVPFTALVCAYDNIAYGAIKELKKHGLRVPEDVSVIGMDNNIVSGYTETSLTSIDTDPDDMSKKAWGLLQAKLRNPYFKAQRDITIPGTLVVRESVKRLDK